MAEEIQQYFTSYRSPGWTAPVETVPQESTPLDPLPQIQPDGWVINSSANVFIDEEGLHIYDGALYLIDISGSSVLGPSGFSGAWSGFIASGGIYNSLFTSGTPGDLVVTEVGTGNTTADYEASLSAQLPYWIVTEDDYNALSLVSDTTAPGQRALQIDTSVLPLTEPTLTAIFYQDVAITPGKSYLVELMLKAVSAPSGRLRIEASWRDSDHGLIGSPTGFGYGWYINGMSELAYEPYLFQVRTDAGDILDSAPANATFLRLKIGVGGDVANAGAIRIGGVRLYDESPSVGRILFHNRTNWDDSIDPAELYSDGGSIMMRSSGNTHPSISLSSSLQGGVLSFGPGDGATDVRLSREGVGHLQLGDGDRWDAEYCGIGLSRNASVAVSTSSHTTMTFPDVPPISAQGGDFTVTSNHTITVDHSGIYDISVQIVWAAAAGSTRRIIGICFDGATTSDVGDRSEHVSPSSAVDFPQQFSAKYYLTAGQTVKVTVWHNHGSNIDVKEGRFNLFWLGR